MSYIIICGNYVFCAYSKVHVNGYHEVFAFGRRIYLPLKLTLFEFDFAKKKLYIKIPFSYYNSK